MYKKFHIKSELKIKEEYGKMCKKIHAKVAKF